MLKQWKRERTIARRLIRHGVKPKTAWKVHQGHRSWWALSHSPPVDRGVNGAKASNVFWQVGSSATFATSTVFKGTVMAYRAITLNTGATLDGRALARVAAVNLNSNTVTKL